MSKEKIIVHLVDIRDELMTIAPDDDPNGAFECAWEWWTDRCLKKGWRTHQFFYTALDRGWLAPMDAESFCNFLNQHHFWRCLRRL